MLCTIQNFLKPIIKFTVNIISSIQSAYKFVNCSDALNLICFLFFAKITKKASKQTRIRIEWAPFLLDCLKNSIFESCYSYFRPDSIGLIWLISYSISARHSKSTMWHSYFEMCIGVHIFYTNRLTQSINIGLFHSKFVQMFTLIVVEELRQSWIDSIIHRIFFGVCVCVCFIWTKIAIKNNFTLSIRVHIQITTEPLKLWPLEHVISFHFSWKKKQ